MIGRVNAALAMLVDQSTFDRGEPVDESLIREAELELGRLPRIYREFIAEFGYLRTPDVLIFGLGGGLPEDLDLQTITRRERCSGEPRLPRQFVAFSHDREDSFYCLKVDPTEDIPRVYLLDREFGSLRPYPQTFVEWLLEQIEICPQFWSGFGWGVSVDRAAYEESE